MRKTLKSLFVILLILVTYYFIQVFTAVIMMAVYQLINGTVNSQLFINKYSELALIISIIIMIPILFYISKLVGRDMINVCNFNKIEMKKVILALILGISLNIAILLVMNILYVNPYIKEVIDQYNEYSKIYTSGNFIMSIIAYGIFAPIIEEIIFRGFVLTELSDVMPVWGAVIIQGLIFGMYHLNEVQFFYASFIGIVIGFAYVWTGSLYIPVVAHMANNIFSSVLSKVNLEVLEDNQLAGLFILLAYIIILGFGIFIMKYFKDSSNKINNKGFK